MGHYAILGIQKRLVTARAAIETLRMKDVELSLKPRQPLDQLRAKLAGTRYSKSSGTE